ncbi:MAG TPA: ribonuclease P protein component [Bacteroidota bacterium]|nr:ribonuclease P protein component [Bacteroidota bacterium]HRT67541.1 ribonuclease P protein component [Bacteroidota bacterium]
MLNDLNLSPLKGFNSFNTVFKNGESFYNENVLLIICNKSSNISLKQLTDSSNKILYGVSVPKKKFKKAVVRNRIKRLMRVSIRHSLEELNKFYDITELNVIVAIWRGQTVNKPNEIGLNDVEPYIYNGLKKYLENIKNTDEKDIDRVN